jgi:hypothetical protein
MAWDVVPGWPFVERRVKLRLSVVDVLPATVMSEKERIGA